MSQWEYISNSSLAHSVQLKEKYSIMKILLKALKCEEYLWEISGDFKMVTFLVVL